MEILQQSPQENGRDQRRKQELVESFFPAVCFVEGFLPGDKAGKKKKGENWKKMKNRTKFLLTMPARFDTI